MNKTTLLACLALAAAAAHAQHPEPVAYATNGQNADQAAKDRDDCRRWARSESGYTAASPRALFPPQLPLAPAMSPPSYALGTNDVTFMRAMAACLEGRGYTVR